MCSSVLDTKFLQVKELCLICIGIYLYLSINSFTHKGLMQVDLKNVFMLANRILFLKLVSCVQLIEMPKECINKIEGNWVMEWEWVLVLSWFIDSGNLLYTGKEVWIDSSNAIAYDYYLSLVSRLVWMLHFYVLHRHFSIVTVKFLYDL